MPSTERLTTLLKAASDEAIVERYFAKISRSGSASCWLWTGAISGKGHGRFWIGGGVVVVAHRFGWVINAGAHVQELPEVVSHSCDNPLCQNPAHLHASTFSSNRIEYLQRRGTPRSPLRDKRGARGRARELRDAAKPRSTDQMRSEISSGVLGRGCSLSWRCGHGSRLWAC